MNYEKKIKEIIENDEINDDFRYKLASFFPELAESKDERTRKGLLHVIKHHPLLPLEEQQKYTAWLEKQGEQKTFEWSKEDEAFYQRLEQIVCKVDIEAFQGDIDLHSWLKSFRTQSHWKPTDEQMKVLNEVINFAADHGTMRWNDYIYNVLKSLREQLKKLTE